MGIASPHLLGRAVLLPMHTDPSLISIVIHDRECIQAGSLGLEVQVQQRDGCGCNWHEVPCSGHGVVTVFCGSVLDRISGGLFTACRHRVVDVTSDEGSYSGPRVAAT